MLPLAYQIKPQPCLSRQHKENEALKHAYHSVSLLQKANNKADVFAAEGVEALPEEEAERVDAEVSHA